jgi:predicted metal-dependent phosphoesterase TrpH
MRAVKSRNFEKKGQWSFSQRHAVREFGLSTFLVQLQDCSMAYKIDLHCHSWYSGDGVSSPEAMIASAKKKGIDGLALTDHNTCDGFRHLLDKGLAREDGKPVDGFLVIPGVEMTTAEGHLLCLGVMLPNLKGTPAAEVCKLVHERGGLAIPAHPYDMLRAGIRQSVLETLEMDGLEVFNAATTFKRFNRQAFEFAQLHNLPMTAGSDAHHEAAVATAYTIFPTEDFTVSGILGQIGKGIERSERYLTTRDAMRKTLNNWMRIRKKRVHAG